MPQLHLQWVALFIVWLKLVWIFWSMLMLGQMVNVSYSL
jgi:hypothetical protein